MYVWVYLKLYIKSNNFRDKNMCINICIEIYVCVHIFKIKARSVFCDKLKTPCQNMYKTRFVKYVIA